MCIITIYFVGWNEDDDPYKAPLQIVCERDTPAFRVCFMINENPMAEYFTVQNTAFPGYCDDIANGWELSKLKKNFKGA